MQYAHTHTHTSIVYNVAAIANENTPNRKDARKSEAMRLNERANKKANVKYEESERRARGS